ncbi:hypothetical protein B0H15DRAFT_836633 [Mycena belliarum]|uniref:Uncharacterized protein n=1 Tax=Mycena belliarum TaxID=1033014 RepID=A0AAD6U695_9AGAR|nr:hypothetical protein B0H15DRAFT_836633 [Mycena belliae]
MAGQVLWSHSEVDNGRFAGRLAQSQHGLHICSWIVSDSRSQFDYGFRGMNACSIACLQFARHALRSAHSYRTAPDTGSFLSEILTRGFFRRVLAICAEGPESGPYAIDTAYETFDFAQELIPLLYGAPRPASRTYISGLIAALKETGLRTALTITSANHHRACVYVPPGDPRLVPLYLIFDSAQSCGRGASIAVHTSSAAAAAYLIGLYVPGATLSGDFFVFQADSSVRRARTAARVLDLRFGAARVLRDNVHPQAHPPGIFDDAEYAYRLQLEYLRELGHHAETFRAGVARTEPNSKHGGNRDRWGAWPNYPPKPLSTSTSSFSPGLPRSESDSLYSVSCSSLRA